MGVIECYCSPQPDSLVLQGLQHYLQYHLLVPSAGLCRSRVIALLTQGVRFCGRPQHHLLMFSLSITCKEHQIALKIYNKSIKALRVTSLHILHSPPSQQQCPSTKMRVCIVTSSTFLHFRLFSYKPYLSLDILFSFLSKHHYCQKIQLEPAGPLRPKVCKYNIESSCRFDLWEKVVNLVAQRVY